MTTFSWQLMKQLNKSMKEVNYYKYFDVIINHTDFDERVIRQNIQKIRRITLSGAVTARWHLPQRPEDE